MKRTTPPPLNRPETIPPLNRPESIPTLRILDAAGNRAADGLRVVEDYARFALDDAHLTGRLKDLRHRLADALTRLDGGARLASRDASGDVGTGLTTLQESRRAALVDVAAAAFARLGQALRTLEEYGKLIDSDWAERFQAFRYESYTLEKAIDATRSGAARLADARLYALIDGRETPAAFAQVAEALVAGGVEIIQLRDKALADRELLIRARTLREITSASGVLFIMNDRPDLAQISHADGVHVGQDELGVKDARTIVGAGPLIGVSTRTLEQARRAVLDGANYVGVGPTFASATKTFAALAGLELLSAVAAEIRLPAFAIGGINEDSLPSVCETGVHGVAVGAALTSAGDPRAAATRLKKILKSREGAIPRAVS